MKHYTRQTLLIALLACGMIAGANWLANPYLMFNAPMIPGINQWITENYYKQLLFKPYQLRLQKPQSLILGASQAGVAFNPDLLPQPAYNLAVGGSTSYLQYRLLQEALAASPAINHVILETPFLSFNNDDPNNTPGADAALEHRLSLQRDGNRNFLRPGYAAEEILSSLLSWDITRASIRMISKQEAISNKSRGSFIQLRNGQWIQQASPDSHTRQLMKNSWKKTLFNDWLPAPAHSYSLGNGQHGPLYFYRQNLRQLYQRNIDTRIVIAPMHASLMIGLQQARLWPTYQQWKKSLLAINSEEAASAGKPAFPLFDYAVINEQTTENFPAAESTTPMQGFNDSIHVSPQRGDLILREILSGTPQTGRLLDSDNIDKSLAGDDIALTRYIETHPDMQAEMQQLFRNHETP